MPVKHNNIILLTPDRKNDLFYFLNRSFDRPTGTMWFPPGYDPTNEENMDGQYAIVHSDRIIASAAIIPRVLHLGKNTLNVANIANVAVDPDYRLQGLMRILLEHLIGVIHEQQYPISILGGQRQRYQHQGWERAGSWARFTTNFANFKHLPELDKLAPVTMEPLGDNIRREKQTVADLVKLHAVQRVRCDRPAKYFIPWLARRDLKPLIARDETGKIVGYVVIHEERSIKELVVDEPATALRIGRALSHANPSCSFEWQLESADSMVIQAIGSVAEEAGQISSGNWQVFDWPRVLNTLMNFCHQNNALAPGSVTISIRGLQTIRLYVEDGNAGCEVTDRVSNLIIEPMKLARMLFGPQPVDMVMPLPLHAAILKAWCPLPLSIPVQDRF